MKNAKVLGVVSLAACVLLAGCNGNSTSTNSNSSTEMGSEQINWSSVSSSDNPQTTDNALNLNGITNLKINIFNFNGDVQLTYSPSQQAGTGILRLYSVSSDSSSLGWITQSASGGTMNVSANGTYNCNYSASNGKITALQGACYVKMQIILPSTAQNILVYNDGTQITN